MHQHNIRLYIFDHFEAGGLATCDNIVEKSSWTISDSTLPLRWRWDVCSLSRDIRWITSMTQARHYSDYSLLSESYNVALGAKSYIHEPPMLMTRYSHSDEICFRNNNSATYCAPIVQLLLEHLVTSLHQKHRQWEGVLKRFYTRNIRRFNSTLKIPNN